MMKFSKTQWVTLIVAGGLAIWGLTTWIGSTVHRKQLRQSIGANLDYLTAQVSEYEMQKRSEALRRLASSKAIQEFAGSESQRETPDLLNYLEAYRSSLGASIIYIMNHSGDVIACTPYGDGQTLTGKNYTIRPYFQKGLAGIDYLYGGLGLTTGERGFYYSTSTKDAEDGVTYVIVAKYPITHMDEVIKANPTPAVLVTPSGVVFSSHDDSLLYRPAISLTEESLEALRRSKQFSDRPLEPLPFPLENDAFNLEGRTFLVERRDIAARGWMLISWDEYTIPWASIVNYTLFFYLGYLVACFLIYFYQQKQAFQRDLVLSQKDYQAIFNASADAIFIHDLKTGEVIDVNQRMCEMYACQPSDIIGGNPETFSANEVPYTGDEAIAYIQKAAQGEDQLFEWHARKLTGELFWVEVHLKRTELSGAPRLIAVVRDISDRMDAMLRLRKLSKAIEASPASVMITDRKGEVEYVNAAFSELTGYTYDEVVGKSSAILKSGVHPESYYADLWETILKGQVWSGEMCNLTKDKRMFWELARIAPIYDVDGDISHFVAVKGDITELKMAEKMLRASKQEAEQAARAKATFLANMSHEIRTPLNAVIGFINLSAERGNIPEETKSNLNLAQRAAHELLQLINDILDTSKLESGKMLLEVISFDLEQLNEEVEDLFKTKAVERGLTWSVEFANNVAPVREGDPAKIKQVLYNLVGNAMKFTPKGRVTLRITNGLGKDEVIFEVSDTGIGIPDDLQSHIFSPFAQADESTTRRFGGSGLGTTISRQLVEFMGGRIWLNSEENKGSTFSFALPLPRSTPRKDDPAIRTPVKGEKSVSAGSKNLRVLMAEDVDINQRLTQLWFDKSGYSLTVAANGEEAVKLVQEGKFDLILMDIHMPVMDGLMATREIRKREAATGRHIPIIALTASVMKEECEEYLAAGMDDVIGKPIDFELLFRKIDDLEADSQRTSGTVKSVPIEVQWKSVWQALKSVSDRETAIQHWGGFENVVSALKEFVSDHKDTADRVKESINEQNLSAVTERVKRLKGASGNLSLTLVFPAAIALEEILLNKESDGLEEAASTLADSLDDTMTVVGDILNFLDDNPEFSFESIDPN